VGQARNLPVKVLLVEDSRVIRERLIEALDEPGRIEIVGYADTELAAKDWLRDAVCDAIVLDLQLKQGSGLEVLKATRALAHEPRVVVIVLTNYSLPHFRERSMRLGADYFFDKAAEYERVHDVLDDLARSRNGTAQ
jgi:DNA-binding NarL/FixJ family response regulator